MLGCQFVDVADGESGILLGQLKGEFEENDELQVTDCDELGHLSSKSYFYWTEDAGTGWDGDGWYDAETTLKANDDTTIPHGTAMWFTGVNSAKGVTVAGQVYGGEYVHHFTKITEMVCSAFPVAFNPNEVEWVGLTEGDEIQVTMCDEFGHLSSKSYFWWTEDAGTGWDGDGWYDAETTMKADEAVVVAGQGFWLTMADPLNVTMTELSPVK